MFFLVDLSVAGWLSLLTLLAIMVYFGMLRPYCLRWGATPEDVKRYLPGDELVPGAKMNSTRAVVIGADAEAIWPWLVQMGQDRGGFYSYSWLENIMGLDIRNVDQIIPLFQGLKTGDIMKFSSKGGMKVLALEPARVMVLGDLTANQEVEPTILASWVFYLEHAGINRTKLLVRFRLTWPRSFYTGLAYRIILEPIHFLMERKMLLGIRSRAEKLFQRTMEVN